VRDLELLYDSIGAETSQAAFEWFNSLADTIYSLDRMPERGGTTAESSRHRQLLFGNTGHVYRIIYEIDKRKRLVTVVHIRHGARAL
jgi:toxin ParE1/3/4